MKPKDKRRQCSIVINLNIETEIKCWQEILRVFLSCFFFSYQTIQTNKMTKTACWYCFIHCTLYIHLVHNCKDCCICIAKSIINSSTSMKHANSRKQYNKKEP